MAYQIFHVFSNFYGNQDCIHYLFALNLHCKLIKAFYFLNFCRLVRYFDFQFFNQNIF
jgi:hypothetical protein